MDNPYKPSIATPAPRGQRRLNWRAMLLAYGVHHAASVAGVVTGGLFVQDVLAFEPHKLWGVMVFIPLLDAALVAGAFDEDHSLPASLVWSVRALAVLTIPFAIGAYGAWRHRVFLWYLGVVSFLAYLSLAMRMDQVWSG